MHLCNDKTQMTDDSDEAVLPGPGRVGVRSFIRNCKDASPCLARRSRVYPLKIELLNGKMCYEL